MKSFFFYDLETSGLKPREDRIMQFAGQRTDMELNPIGEPVNILVKITDDCLPSPGAIMVIKITPQQTLQDGMSEAEFCKYVTEEIFTPETVALGYNTVRFDDEFMRAILWRNFYDPYEWEWKDGRSRWDMLDVVRFTRALRPDGINWPVTDDGKPTNRLELLTKANGLEHSHAHDALSDVYATIAVAKMIREKQPKMFDFLFKMRSKNNVKKLVNLEDKQPFVYTSGRYAATFEKTTVAFPLTAGRNGNILVYDLRYNLGDIDTEKTYPIVKELCLNKCPVVAPLSVLDSEDGWKKIDLSKKQVNENLKTLLEAPDFAEKMRSDYENRPEFPPSIEPEVAIYDGFLNNADRIKVAAVRNAEPNKLADFHPDFIDTRLPDLLLHYKGRNYPQTLSEKEVEDYAKYRQDRLARQAPKFLDELKAVYEKDAYIGEELKLYYESLLDFD
jgi:exodeoxyribonuclease I